MDAAATGRVSKRQGTALHVSQIRPTVLPLTLVTVRTDYSDCCPYIVQYTRYTALTLFVRKTYTDLGPRRRRPAGGYVRQRGHFLFPLANRGVSEQPDRSHGERAARDHGRRRREPRNCEGRGDGRFGQGTSWGFPKSRHTVYSPWWSSTAPGVVTFTGTVTTTQVPCFTESGDCLSIHRDIPYIHGLKTDLFRLQKKDADPLPGDVSHWVDAVVDLLRFPEKRDALGMAARQSTHGLTWDRTFASLRRSYDRCRPGRPYARHLDVNVPWSKAAREAGEPGASSSASSSSSSSSGAASKEDERPVSNALYGSAQQQGATADPASTGSSLSLSGALLGISAQAAGGGGGASALAAAAGTYLHFPNPDTVCPYNTDTFLLQSQRRSPTTTTRRRRTTRTPRTPRARLCVTRTCDATTLITLGGTRKTRASRDTVGPLRTLIRRNLMRQKALVVVQGSPEGSPGLEKSRRGRACVKGTTTLAESITTESRRRRFWPYRAPAPGRSTLGGRARGTSSWTMARRRGACCTAFHTG